MLQKYRIVLLAMGLLIATAMISGAQTETEKIDGQQIYEDNCGKCHNGGFKGWITGSPKIGKPKDWSKFFPTGLDTLVKWVVTGEKGHDKKGDCEECTQEDIRAAVIHIMEATKDDE